MQTVANEMGWKYSTEISSGSIPYANSFHLFAQSRFQGVCHVMYGEAEGVRVTVFDYNFGRKWVKGQGTLRKQTVAMVQSDKLNLPAFFLRPGILDTNSELYFPLRSNFPRRQRSPTTFAALRWSKHLSRQANIESALAGNNGSASSSAMRSEPSA